MATIRSFAKDLKFSILKSFELYIFSFLAISSIQKGSGAIKSAFRNRVETNKSEGRDSTREMGRQERGTTRAAALWISASRAKLFPSRPIMNTPWLLSPVDVEVRNETLLDFSSST